MEIASNVNRDDDGRPAYVVMGVHHAREWPSAEVSMEFALDLADGYGTDPRITALLDRVRVLVFPVINPDGFVETIGDKLGFMSRQVDGDMKRFKEFIEQRGAETGAWRGEIHGGQVEGSQANI